MDVVPIEDKLSFNTNFDKNDYMKPDSPCDISNWLNSYDDKSTLLTQSSSKNLNLCLSDANSDEGILKPPNIPFSSECESERFSEKQSEKLDIIIQMLKSIDSRSIDQSFEIGKLAGMFDVSLFYCCFFIIIRKCNDF